MAGCVCERTTAPLDKLGVDLVFTGLKEPQLENFPILYAQVKCTSREVINKAMNLIVKDLDLFQNLEPEAVANYLESRGWQQQREIDSEAIIWGKNGGGKSSSFNLVLPLNKEVPDFSLTMSLLVENLAKIEEKTQLEIIQKLIKNFPNVEIQGLISGIKSPRDRLSGEIILMGIVLNKLQKITTELFDLDYIRSVKAYQERLPVSCWGDLIKENNSFVLKNVRDFAVDESWVN